MIRLLRLTDPKLILMHLKREDCYKAVLDIDNLDNWRPDLTNCYWVAGINEEDNVIGFLVFHKKCGRLLEFHGSVYKPFRNRSIEYLRDSLKQIKELTNAKFITSQRSSHKAASILVRKCGFKKVYQIDDIFDNGDGLIIYGEK